MSLPTTMRAMVTMGHGDLDQMVMYNDWPRPDPAPGEVLIRVGACGLNNTDVNTRSGWYSKAVSEATTGGAFAEVGENDPTWGGAPIQFPRIQGADVCGEIVAVGDGVYAGRIGERVITDNWLRDAADPGQHGQDRLLRVGTGWRLCRIHHHSGGQRDCDPVGSVGCGTGDVFLFLFHRRGHVDPCQCHQGRHGAGPGASGGVGGALVQLAKLRGARVIALASDAKHTDVAALGADRVLPRAPDNLCGALGKEKITVVADVVGGPIGQP
jgi:NADPH:quinone reductase-like Zn-dependent oxidoreductase